MSDEVIPIIAGGRGDPDDFATAERVGGDRRIAWGAGVLLPRLDTGWNVLEDRLGAAVLREIELPVLAHQNQIESAVLGAAEALEVLALNRIGLEIEAKRLLIGAETHPLHQQAGH